MPPKAPVKGKGGKGAKNKFSFANLAALPPPKPFEYQYQSKDGPTPAIEPFNAAKAAKDSTGLKSLFEDPDGHPVLPHNLEKVTSSWVRIPELTLYKDQTPEVYVPPAPELKLSGSKAFRYASGLRAPSNDWAQLLAFQLNFIVKNKTKYPDTEFLWELIWPKDKSNAPQFHDKGKYIVKLFHQGEWRQITIDDHVPVDSEGVPVIPISQNPTELWPLILSKALLKLHQGEEMGASGLHFLTSLSGWIPQFQSVRSSGADEANFAWHRELKQMEHGGPCVGAMVCKAVNPDASTSIGATVANASVASALSVGEADAEEDGNEEAAGGEGDEEEGQKFVDTQGKIEFNDDVVLYSCFYIVPYSAETPEHDEDADPGKGAKGGKAKAAKGKKSKKEEEEEKKKAEEQAQKSDEAAEALRQKKEEDAARVARMAVPGADILDDPNIPKYWVVDLHTGVEEIVTEENIKTIFDDITIVFSPTLFPHSQIVNDFWKESTQPFNMEISNFLYIPPVPTLTPADPEGADDGAGNASPEALPVELSTEESEPQQYCKVLFNVESHLTARRFKSRGAGASGAEPRPDEKPCFVLEVEEYNWSTNQKLRVAYLPSHSFAGCLEVFFPLSKQGHVYRVTVQSAAGFYMQVLSEYNFVLESNNCAEGEIWAEYMNMNYQADSGSYSAIKEDAWTVLFKYQMSGASAGTGGADKGGKKGKPDPKAGKGKKPAKGGAVEDKPALLPCNVPTPFQDIECPMCSFHLSFSDPDIVNCVAWELVDNDTYVSTRLSGLDTAPFKLVENERGYTLVASVLSTRGLPSGKWDISVISSKPLSLSQELLSTLSEYGDVYKKNFDLNLCRVVVGGSSKPDQTAIEVRSNDPAAGLICNVYNLDDLMEEEDPSAAVPLIMTVGRPAIYLPALEVTKEQKFLFDVRVDPKNQGKLTTPVKEGEDEKRWTLRCFSGAAVVVQADKTQEEEFTAIKQAWWKAQAGRDKKAKSSRDKFLEERQKLADMKKQPIVDPIDPTKEHTMTEQEMDEARKIRDAAVVRGDLLLKVMTEERDKQTEMGAKQAEQLDSLRSDKVQALSVEDEEHSKKRSEYRQKTIAHMDAIGVLRSAVDAQVALSAKAGGDKKAKGKGDKSDGLSLGEHYASVEAAIGALGELPEWKTKGIIAEAKNRLCVLAIQSLQESMNLAVEATTAASADEPKKGGKKKDDDRVDVAEPVLAAIKHARSLKSDVVSPKVGLWIERADAYLLESALGELEACLRPENADEAAETDVDKLRFLLERVDSYCAKGLSAGAAALVQEAQAKLEDDKTKEEGGDKKVAKKK